MISSTNRQGGVTSADTVKGGVHPRPADLIFLFGLELFLVSHRNPCFILKSQIRNGEVNILKGLTSDLATSEKFRQRHRKSDSSLKTCSDRF